MINPAELERRQKLFENGYWEIPDNLDTRNFDFGWRPDIWDRPYIHQFGTQWQKTGGPRFVIPESEGIKYQNFQHAIKLPDENSRNWRKLKHNATIDYSWHPDDTEPPFIYVFGNQWYDSEIMPTIQYRVTGATDKKYINDVKATLLPDNENRSWRPLVHNATIDLSWVPHPHDPPYIYVFGNQWYDSEIMPTYQYRVEGATDKKYIKDVKATLLPDTDNRCWRPLVPNVTFDYSWVPHPHDPPYIYVFGNQWYDVDLMPSLQYKVQGATEYKFVTDLKATLLPNKEDWDIPDYVTEFDYSWVPHPHDPPFEHQFPTKWHYTAGPTYFAKNHKGLKYQNHLIAETNDDEICDVVYYKDSILNALMEHKFKRPFVYLKSYKNNNINVKDILCNSDSLIHVFDGLEAIVSKRVLHMLFDRLYDYNDIQYHVSGIMPDLLDIVFISNGEQCSEENYQTLLSLNLPNKIHRVDNVKGRVKSQHKAAEVATTEWYFLINAKLKVNNKFDFNWKPDVLKSRRHYIFRATNILNGLEYGHMAIVANNKTLTLNTHGYGLDFTLDSPTEVVDINCGTGIYNSNEWDTWRTAFREVIKLCYYKDTESKKRLEIWQSVANGKNSEYSLKGAKDAIDYYNEVNGDLSKLKLTYEWDWLKERFNK